MAVALVLMLWRMDVSSTEARDFRAVAMALAVAVLVLAYQGGSAARYSRDVEARLLALEGVDDVEKRRT